MRHVVEPGILDDAVVALVGLAGASGAVRVVGVVAARGGGGAAVRGRHRIDS